MPPRAVHHETKEEPLMPFTWRINIRQNPKPPGPAIFEFDQPPQIQVGDQIIWSNDDTVAHFPTPVNQTYVFMTNQIAAKSTSPGFAPSTPGTINYVCSLHPGESGTIVVS
jgi:plastocyanin